MKNIQISEGILLSQIITTLLENDVELNEALEKSNESISINALQNCREQGFTYTVYSKAKAAFFTWCTYEHRNSDEIIINGKEGYHSSNGDLPYKGDSKYNYLASFDNQKFAEAANELASQIIQFIESE